MKALEFLDTLDPHNIVQYCLEGSNSMCLYAHEARSRFKDSLPTQYIIEGDVELTEKGIFFFTCTKEVTNAPSTTLKPSPSEEHIAGTCPLCLGSNIEYGSIELFGDSISYPAECKSCGTTFDEGYSLTFIDHENIEVCSEAVDHLDNRFFFYDEGNGHYHRVNSHGVPIPTGRQEPLGYLDEWNLDIRVWIECPSSQESPDE